MKISSILRTTTLLTAIALPALSCFAQQEVAPTWHDPWAITPPAAQQTAVAAKPAKPTGQPKENQVAATHERQVHKKQQPAAAHVEKTDSKDTSAAGSL